MSSTSSESRRASVRFPLAQGAHLPPLLKLTRSLCFHTLAETELEELALPESDVLENLNKVSTAKRVAAMALHDAGFGEKQKNRQELERRRKKRDRIRSGLE